ncbi:MAG TPA: NfeD family protein, partial [Caulobacteraceae bacterium]|nr:NfeD family protein [Caulobacteraceae bacterium]
FLVIEIFTGSGWLLWPAAAAALVAIAGRIIALPVAGQVALFAGTTIVATYVGRRLMPRPGVAGADINDPATRLIGHRGEAAAPFVARLGRVFVDGKEWAAELEGDGPLPAGARVEVTAVVGGARLRVRAEP